jgi:hypothetical protein
MSNTDILLIVVCIDTAIGLFVACVVFIMFYALFKPTWGIPKARPSDWEPSQQEATNSTEKDDSFYQDQTQKAAVPSVVVPQEDVPQIYFVGVSPVLLAYHDEIVDGIQERISQPLPRIDTPKPKLIADLIHSGHTTPHLPSVRKIPLVH